MKTQIDRDALRRDGWQVIETEEERQRFSPGKSSDEWWTGSGWHDRLPMSGKGPESMYAKFESNIIYRRRIPAPVETTPEDEIANSLCGSARRAYLEAKEKQPTAAPASGWISTKDRLPTEADANSDGDVYWANSRHSCAQRDTWTEGHGATHWRPCPDIPPLPEPVKPKSQDELDTEEFAAWAKEHKICNLFSYRLCYLAGLRAERAREQPLVDFIVEIQKHAQSPLRDCCKWEYVLEKTTELLAERARGGKGAV